MTVKDGMRTRVRAPGRKRGTKAPPELAALELAQSEPAPSAQAAAAAIAAAMSGPPPSGKSAPDPQPVESQPADRRPADTPPSGQHASGERPNGRPAGGEPPRADDSPFLRYIVQNPEAFAQNLARVVEGAGKAAAAYLRPRESGENRNELADELATVFKTLAHVGEYWLADPARAIEAQTSLWSAYMDVWTRTLKRMAGEDVEPAMRPDPRDKRFQDVDWSENQFFDFVKQMYLVTSCWADRMVGEAVTLDPHTRHKAEFYVKQIANAIAPSNFLLTNPELLRETFASNGENLVRGIRMLAEDIEAGGGDLKIRQSNPGKFAVGDNLATTPGKVIFQNDVCQVIQYEPTTETVYKRPLLIVPPWINKFYILDLNPEKSFIKWAVGEGRTVFVVSWVNPDRTQATKSFEHYMQEGILAALDVVEGATGCADVDTIGYCVGGTLLAVTLAWCAAKGDDRIKSATLFTTQVDFTYAGDLKVFVDEEQVKLLEQRMAERGYLEGKKMASSFNMLRSNDLIWPYFVNNYMKGQEPFPFDLLYWNSDSTRMPAANHSFYLRNCYLENRLTRGCMEVGGVRLDLGRVTVPIYNLAAREDHIAPARSVFLGCRSFGGPVTYVMAGSGHIAGVINPVKKPKYQYWAGPEPAGAFEDWIARATETPGSWWPHWAAWLANQAPEQVKARMPGGGKFKPIEDAPGSYVKAKS
ncbi:MAG: class I poly(R)-hydroxyalkanoic acid synthase [Ancalomicrobiaceae bacterium]|nr:class I poly(R)-hydroxyalkanoic acid synthase [Ancalomicrobiaceae bacterium]